MTLDIKLLAMLFAVNGAPIILQRLLGDRWNAALDAGWNKLDGAPLFGPSKTWRGVLGALVAGPLAALALDFPLRLGLIAAAGAMAGDLLSSFAKRRLKIAASGQALGLDQIPESLLPLLLMREPLALADRDIFIIVVDFLVLELLISRLLYRLHIRQQPY